MKTVNLGAEPVSIESEFGAVVVELADKHAKVRVVASKGNRVQIGPTYPIVGFELTMQPEGFRKVVDGG